jgi:prolyl oligopeptidase
MIGTIKILIVAVALALLTQISIDPSMSASPVSTPNQNSDEDPFLWLEDVGGDRPLAWVREQNAASQATLETADGFDRLRGRLLSIYESDERIPNISKRGEFYYNFWRDARHVRGVWRRTTLEEYRKAEPAWETLIDLDQLAESEKENWVWKDA